MASKSVRMTVEWSLPIGQARPITMALHSLADDIRSAHGCVGCSVSTDITSRGVVRYVEDWRTEDDLRFRLRSDEFVRLVTLMEDTTQPPRVEFELARGTRGFDFVEEVRGARTP